MDAFAQSSEDSPVRAKLSGVLLESVEEVRREPIAKQDLARALDRARRPDDASSVVGSPPTSPRCGRRDDSLGRHAHLVGMALGGMV